MVATLTGESPSTQAVSRLWSKLRTGNVIERCFVGVRRRTRPMVVFTNVARAERIIYAIFSRFNEDGKNHTVNLLTQAA